MKKGNFSLNANAASYIPLCRRGAVGENKDHVLTDEGAESRNTCVDFESHPDNTTLNHYHGKPSQDYLHHGNSTSEDYSLEGTASRGSYASSSKNPKEMLNKDILDEDFDMDLAYLQMQFPGFSDESLSHMYLANNGDLENTVDMLSQLELCASDSSEYLPETLEIGDTSESQSAEECSPLKQKEEAGEISGSSGS